MRAIGLKVDKRRDYRKKMRGMIMPTLLSLTLASSYAIFNPSFLFKPMVFLLLGILILWGIIESLTLQGEGKFKIDLIDVFLQIGGLIGLICSVRFANHNHKSIVFLRFSGFTLLILGIVLRFLAMRTLGTYFSYALKADKGHQQVIDYGVYRYIRHPSYVGVFLIVLSTPLIHASMIGFFPAFIFSWLYLQKRILHEEKIMMDTLGEAYIGYRKKTKKMIPFIY